LIKRKEGFEMKIWNFESPDSDSRAKRKTKNKIRAEIAIGKIADKSLEKKNDEQANERTFAVCD